MTQTVKKTIYAFWLTLMVVLVGSCSKSLQVNYDYNSSVNLRQFKTFQVEAEKRMDQDPLLGSDLNRQRLKDAVVKVMLAKGYVIDDKQPELLVKFLTDVKDRQQVRSNNNYPSYWWWNSPMQNNFTTYTYQESRFIINIYQSETRNMIWQGWASGRVKAPKKNEDRSKMVENTILDILHSFPQATLDTYSRN